MLKKEKRIIEKKHRLIPEAYIGGQVISITICIKDRARLFENKDVVSIFEDVLLDELKNFDCSSFIYLFMPDHFHIIISGNKSNSDPRECIAMFKQKTGYWLSKNKPSVRWQKGYYDHILRKNEDLITHVNYILYNPVRAGLVEYWKEYRSLGSTEYNLKEWD